MILEPFFPSHSVYLLSFSLQVSKEKPPQSYIELKTNREILTDRNKSSFRRYKLMKWWAQSFLVGVPKITCGFRNDDGVVKVLQTFKTAEIPHETQVIIILYCCYDNIIYHSWKFLVGIKVATAKFCGPV